MVFPWVKLGRFIGLQKLHGIKSVPATIQDTASMPTSIIRRPASMKLWYDFCPASSRGRLLFMVVHSTEYRIKYRYNCLLGTGKIVHYSETSSLWHVIHYLKSGLHYKNRVFMTKKSITMRIQKILHNEAWLWIYFCDADCSCWVFSSFLFFRIKLAQSSAILGLATQSGPADTRLERCRSDFPSMVWGCLSSRDVDGCHYSGVWVGVVLRGFEGVL